MKKFIFGFIGMVMAAMMVTSCNSGTATQTDDSVAVDSVEVVDSVAVVDTLAADTVAVETVAE